MIDSDKFSKRLQLIMKTNQLSATQFADILKVQRSSISHLLSGRNKPSLEFVLKVLKNFSDVELYWLLNGTGSYPKIKEPEKSTSTLFKTEIKEKSSNELKISSTSKEIERIVIFFKDGSFQNYSA